MKNIELLAPVGDFECLKAAVQNGADAVYLGASSFSARAGAKNFNLKELEEAIYYAKLRNVSVHLALNTLLKNDELSEAFELASSCYELGIDAIIVQDYGLCSLLLKHFPDLPIHASTQMSIHNLEGAQKLEALGFRRVVLARELSIQEIEFIRNHTNIELETFIHGALCISYSGQCLLSSMIGGRSGNRGNCAQSCRLPYELISKKTSSYMDKGYLLSPKDLCGLDFIPNLIDIGVTSLKIEGRLKSPEYVATVTRIYRKYIDLYTSSKEDYVVHEQDKKDLLQVFNRGGFSSGHLGVNPNRDLIFKEKPNNMGIYIGNVSSYQPTKGHITINLNDRIAVGDAICLEREDSKYHISELMIHKKNIESAFDGQLVTIGRMKGNIQPGDKVYKLESKTLSHLAEDSYLHDVKKMKLHCHVFIQKNRPITLEITTPFSSKVATSLTSFPDIALQSAITKERITSQIAKTGNTPFTFEKIDVTLEDGLYVSIRDLNELRRDGLQKVYDAFTKSIKRNHKKIQLPCLDPNSNSGTKTCNKTSLLLNILDIHTNYSELEHVDRVYIPLKYFTIPDYTNVLKNISNSFATYIYMPNIIKGNYRNLFTNHIDLALEQYPIKGFVLSNIGTIHMLEKYKKQYEFIGNYTLNVWNSASIYEYKELGFNTITLSPELSKKDIQELSTNSICKELIVYGNTPVMTIGYCLLGKSNKCYPNCKAFCTKDDTYFLKDRLGLCFRVLPDSIQTVTTIYNSKITSIKPTDLGIDYARIDILDENILEINEIIHMVASGKRFEGKEYTNGNFIRSI